MSRSDGSPTARALIDVIQRGASDDAAAALRELEERAGASNDSRCLAELAEGYYVAREYDEARAVLRHCVEIDPQHDNCRRNLAMAYLHNGQVELCRYHLAALVQNAELDTMRRLAEQQLGECEAAFGLREVDQRFIGLQENALREQATSPSAPAVVYLRLARVILRRGRVTGSASAQTRAIEVLQDATRRFPRDTALLELLISCYQLRDPEHRQDHALRALERLDPESPVLHGPIDLDPVQRTMWTHLHELFQEATGRDHSSRPAALADLSRIVAISPSNPDYRLMYALALVESESPQAALEQAAVLSQLGEESFPVHWGLAQLYERLGDVESQRRHLELAVGYASTEADRQDARKSLRNLEISS